MGLDNWAFRSDSDIGLELKSGTEHFELTLKVIGRKETFHYKTFVTLT